MANAEITYEQCGHTTQYMVWCDCGNHEWLPSARSFYICDHCRSFHNMRPLIKAWIQRPGRLRRLQDHRDELLANLQDIEGQIAKMQEADNERD